MDVEEEERWILCCECAVPIPPNAVNMCVNCLQSHHDIGSGVAKQVQQNTCRGCERFERRDGTWAEVEPESKELLALLLRKPRGLGNVRLVDAAFIWTEPHCRRAAAAAPNVPLCSRGYRRLHSVWALRARIHRG